MKKGIWIITVAALAAVAVLWFPRAEPPQCQLLSEKSCFNQLLVDPAGDWSDYSFVALGHLRSAPGEPVPNELLRNTVQRLFVDDPAFVISLGDLYYNMTDAGLEEIKGWVSLNIPVPFFNAVGNHDTLTGADPLPDGSRTKAGHDTERYEREFGAPDFDFTLGSELFIFIDNGRNPNMSRNQFSYLKGLLERAAADTDIKNIFLLTHKLFWSYNNPAMEPVYRYRHPVRPPVDYRFFLDQLTPLLEPLAEQKRIFLLAGDIGGGSKYLQTFYLQDQHFTYIATGMGTTQRDAFVTISVKDGEVSLKNTNFTSGEESSLENFGLDYWETFYRENPKLAAAADQIDRIE